MADEFGTMLKLGCCALTTLVGVILLGTSFAVLKPTQIGIWYNPTLHKMEYEKGVYQNGRHILGPGHRFKSYSRKLKEYTWEQFPCWTKDKQDVSLPITVFMRIQPDQVIDVHKKFGPGQHSYPATVGPWAYWEDLITMSLKARSKDFHTTTYFTDRAAIESNFTKTLQYAFRDEKVTNISLHMGAVQINDRLRSALVAKVVKQQLEETTRMQRNITLVLADTAVITAKAASKVTILGAQANADASEMIGFAHADAYLAQQKAYATGYKGVVNSLGLSAENLMKYIWARSLASAAGNKDLVVALDGSLPLPP